MKIMLANVIAYKLNSSTNIENKEFNFVLPTYDSGILEKDHKVRNKAKLILICTAE